MNKPTGILLSADVLRQALAGLARVLPRNSTLPVLSTVRVIRHRGTITLTATDLDLRLTYTHRTEPSALTALAQALAEMRWAREPAEGICIPIGALRAAAKGKGDVLITADKLIFNSAVGETTLPYEGIAVDEFPSPSDEHFSPVCSLDAESRTAIVEAAPFMSTDETRYVLNGVLMDSTGDIVATDGRRLYQRTIPALTALPDGVILPHGALPVLGLPAFLSRDWILLHSKGKETFRKPTAEAIRIHKDSLVHWEAASEAARKLVDKPKPPVGEKIPAVPRVRFHAAPWELTSKLIEGNYPNWRQVVPVFEDRVVVTFTPEQAAQLRTVLAQWPRVKVDNDAITLAFPGTGLRLSDQNGTLHLLPGVLSTFPIAACVNRKYLADAMALGTPVLRIFSDQDAMEFTIGTARVIIMPIRTTTIPIEDAAKSAAEAAWEGCTVRLPDTHVGEVLSISRNGRKLVATVGDPPRSAIQRVPLDTLTLVKRPVTAKAA